jgi:LysM repeat protein
MTQHGASRPVPLPVIPATADVCPYLLASDGRWRASTPAREHRCTAVSPAAVLAPEKQRRLCLVAEHRGCSTFAAATGVGGIGDEPVTRDRRRAGRPVARTAPLVLDRGRVGLAVPGIRPERAFGQTAFVGLMAIAFGALIVARLSGGGPALTPGQIAGAAGTTPSPAATQRAGETPAATAAGAPDRTLVPTEVEPTPTPEATAAEPTATEPTATPAASEVAEATPKATAAPKTHTVASGDTLSGIAQEFGTTWQILAALNDLDDPTALRVGQVLDLP